MRKPGGYGLPRTERSARDSTTSNLTTKGAEGSLAMIDFDGIALVLVPDTPVGGTHMLRVRVKLYPLTTGAYSFRTVEERARLGLRPSTMDPDLVRYA